MRLVVVAFLLASVRTAPRGRPQRKRPVRKAPPRPKRRARRPPPAPPSNATLEAAEAPPLVRRDGPDAYVDNLVPRVARLHRREFRPFAINGSRRERAAPTGGATVAVLFTGFLKTDTLAQLEKHVADSVGADVFAVTYGECARTAARLAARVRLVSEDERTAFAAFLDAHGGHDRGLWQWFQLKLAFAAFDFSAYGTLVKSRTDVLMPPAFHYADFAGEAKALHCFSDKVFYSTPATMVALWDDFLNVALDVYSLKHAPAEESKVMGDFRARLARLASPPNTDGGLGCKVPRKDAKQPWDIGGIQSGFYAEWAFSYHVVSHEVACKPLPLDRKYFRNPGRGTVALIRDRHKEAGATCVADATEGP